MTQQLQGDASQPVSSKISEVVPKLLQTDAQPAPELQETVEAPIAQPAFLPVEDCQVVSEPASQKTSSSILQRVFQRFRSITPWLWAIVILVVFLPKVGEIFIAKAFKKPLPDRSSTTLTTPSTTINWQQREKLLARALGDAHQSAEFYASKKLDAWVDDLTERVDSSFLDWYFGYFNQKKIEYKGFFTGVTANMAGWLNPNSQAPEERIAEVITEDFQTEFAKRVLRPQIAQLQLERVSEQTVKHYLNELSLSINKIPAQQNIPKADWEIYLNGISLSARDANGTSISLPIKALLGASAYTLAKPIIAPLLPVVGSKVVATLGGKLGAKIAAKSGAVLAGKIGSTFLDAAVGVGIILWDIWDVNHTASIEKPILRSSLIDYLETVSGSLLDNTDTGIMTVIDHIEEQILQGIQSAKTITSDP
jgi:hypothetical protein